MCKKICLFVVVAMLMPVASVLAQAATTSPTEVIVEHNVEMKTRDGVTLKADIYRPAGDGKYPVLLQRTPYNKNNAGDFGRKAAERGYVVVFQDVRGRYTSEGEWYPFKHETEDGYDAVEWVAALPNSNGKVGMFGGSYVGATQMLTAIGHPPHLAGICPVVTASNYHENWTYQGGAFEQWFNESWTSGLAQDTFDRLVRDGDNARISGNTLPLDQYALFNLKMDTGTADTTKILAPYFLDWAHHPNYDSYWKKWSIEEQYDSIQVPALTIAAWYDIFQGGSLENYLGMKEHAGNGAARKEQRLIVEIGGHAGTGRKIGDLDFGPEAATVDEESTMLDWYDYLFLGKKNHFATDKPVTIFVLGENKWRNEEAWPLKRAKATSYFLHSSGNANTEKGDGALTLAAATTEATDSYIYDPTNPVPTVGGPLCCDRPHLPPGPKDQKVVESRPDVLVYSTPVLDQDTEVTGQISLDLYAASSAVDTDFTAKLVDVWPNGFEQNLTEGILRARYRESRSTPTLIEPGKIYEYKIDLWSTSNLFFKGHKIRVEVSSSNYPRFDRNLNTGKDAASDPTTLKATNTIYHDSAHPSVLTLPIVAR